MSSAKVMDEVSADRIRAHVEKIVTEIPHRAAGSANGRRMAEYSRDAMKANGLTDVVMHELPAIVSFPEHAEFRVESPTEIAVQANTLGHSLNTSDEGISAEIVDVGGGAFSDYAGKDARGDPGRVNSGARRRGTSAALRNCRAACRARSARRATAAGRPSRPWRGRRTSPCA